MKIGQNWTCYPQTLNHGLILKKVHKIIRFNPNALLKPYIDMSTHLKKNNEWCSFWKNYGKCEKTEI